LGRKPPARCQFSPRPPISTLESDNTEQADLRRGRSPEFGIARAGAIVSPGAADADPMQLAHGLLSVALSRGARFVRGRSARIRCRLALGRRAIEAHNVILATGYVMPKIIHSTLQTVSSSWAIATAPQPQNIWKGGALIWEDSRDYLYARTTASGRIIIGGEDSDEVIEPEPRDALIPEKSRILTETLRALWPHAAATSQIAGPARSTLPATVCR
jgi:glycine/D-amino acid oxidase-like deaminating enzyme